MGLRLTLKKAIELLDNKEISLKEIYQDLFEKYSQENNQYNIYLSVNKNSFSEAQTKKDKPLRGLPIAVKDNILTLGLPATASSNILRNYWPQYEATVTKRIKEAGGVVFGKTNLDAWAHGSSTETSDFGPTKNPRNPQYSPGGSSGGSAAAVAADMAIASLGTETAGSIRQPAAWCGVVGLKPTYGRVSRYGIIAMGSSLDCPGPITKTVEDSAILLQLIAGKDNFDATTSSHPVPDYQKNLKKGVKNFKIGICYIDHPQLSQTLAAKATLKAGKIFECLGAEVEIIKTSTQLQKNRILTHEYAISVYTIVQRAEVSSNLARYDGIRYGQSREFFGHEAKNRIILGTFILSKGYAEKYYLLAQKVRRLYVENFKQLFSKYDLLISPASPSFALPLGSSANNPMFGELQDMLVEPSSLAGICGLSIPMFLDEKTNLYLGLNIMGNYFQEEKILQAGWVFEQTTDWNSWKN
ncbi:MAG: aspartyl/glutamyl-tRNA amidotransferase subunit A [Patescibacteria group bacterium]|nr:aspartyl/glutamyl-tRNA amidotransferase subunit A [Patescibacteria group bacterium]